MDRLEVFDRRKPEGCPGSALALRQRESASMTLTPSVEQLALFFAAPSSQAFIGGSFCAEHFAVPIKQSTGGRASYGDTFFLWTNAGEGAGLPAATKLTENAMTPTASN
jgi:hypothetical protein